MHRVAHEDVGAGIPKKKLTVCCLRSFAAVMCRQLRSMPTPMADCIVLPVDMCIKLEFISGFNQLPALSPPMCHARKCHISATRAPLSGQQLRIGRVSQAHQAEILSDILSIAALLVGVQPASRIS